MKCPRVGDRAWEINWCASIPVDEHGTSDIDRADYRVEYYRTRPAADQRAKAVMPLDAFDAVSVTPVEFVAYDEDDAERYPHAGYWDPIGEQEFYNE